MGYQVQPNGYDVTGFYSVAHIFYLINVMYLEILTKQLNSLC